GSGGYSEGAAMQGVHAIRVEIARQVRRATNAADGQNPVGLEPQFDDRLLQRREHAEVPTSRAPVGINLAFEILDRHLGAFSLNHGGHPRLLKPGSRARARRAWSSPREWR